MNWLLSILAAITYGVALWAMWWSGRHRGRADRSRNAAEAWAAATNGWETAKTAYCGLKGVIASDNIDTAKAVAIKAAVKSMHTIATADEIAADTGAPLAFIDKILLEDRHSQDH